MTPKDVALKLLCRMNRLESDRAALGAYISGIRLPSGDQPDWKRIAADPAIQGSVQARHAELSQTILLATDDNSVWAALKELAEEE